MKKHKLTIEFTECEDSLRCGLRMQWCSGTSDNGRDFDLTSGAGVGTPFIIFTKGTKENPTKCLVADVRELVEKLDKLI